MSRLPRGVRRLLRLEERGSGAVDEEIGFHIEMRASELVAEGEDPERARARAEQEFGDVAAARQWLIEDDARHGRRRQLRDVGLDIARDVRLGARALRRAPLFTTVAVATLAIGIGANAALFSIVDGVVLKPLPYPAADRLAVVDQWLLRAEYDMLRERARSYEELAAYRGGVGVGVAGRGEPVRVTAAYASASLFDVLGVRPLQGRGFEPADERGGSEPVVVLTHGLWQEWFAGGPVLGERLQIDGVAHTIVGVMPRGFTYPAADTRLWLPFVMEPSDVGTYWGTVAGPVVTRLAPGTTPAVARDELVAIAAEMRLANPLWTPNEPYRADIQVQPLQEQLTAGSRRPLLLLLGATGFVLLIACANVANLFLVRMIGREHDLAVRAALGSGRAGIVRTVAMESLLLAVAGGALGLALGYGLLQLLLPMLPADTPRLNEVALDGRAVLFALAATALAAALFSLLPALRLSGGRLSDPLRSGARAGESRRSRRLSRLVVCGEVALAVVLLLGSTLLVRSLVELQGVDPGFRTSGVVAARVMPAARTLATSQDRLAFYDRVLADLATRPRIESVALTGQLPFDGEVSLTAAAVEHVTLDPNELPVFEFRQVTPEYFDIMGMPLLQGRGFQEQDRAGSEPVAIVDATAAAMFWPGENPIGRRIGRPWMREWLTVVGVVPGVKNNELAPDEVSPAFYVPFAQQPTTAATVVVRTSAPLGTAADALRGAVHGTDPTVPIGTIRSVDALVRDSVSGPRSITLLLSAFAVVALVLGALGIYGVLAYSVQQRQRELGVRLALGASTGSVRMLVLRDGVRLLAGGLLLGVPLALVLNRFLRGVLYGVAPTDPVSLVVAPLLLMAVGMLAALLPALRASRVAPIITLRGE